jgi:hypothetical protein
MDKRGGERVVMRLPLVIGKTGLYGLGIIFLEGEVMSRFEKFQNTRILNEKNEPLNEQIYISGCAINFENGYICNRFNESEDGTDPAIECFDAHIEFWENGVLNNNGDLAVFSAGDDKVESWENGEKKAEGKYYLKYSREENINLGNKAESNFAKYLNTNNIPFIHLDQPDGELYSKILKEKNIKRPDYIIFIDKKPFFIDVKATGCYKLKKSGLERLTNLQNEYSIDVFFAMIDSSEVELNNFSFVTLDNINKYVAINKLPNMNGYYHIPSALLKREMVFNKIEDNKLVEIYNEGGNLKNLNTELYFSDILQKYFEKNNYKIIKEKK